MRRHRIDHGRIECRVTVHGAAGRVRVGFRCDLDRDLAEPGRPAGTMSAASGAAAGSVPEACSLLTAAEFSATTGTTVTALATGPVFCVYRVGHSSVGGLDVQAAWKAAFDRFMSPVAMTAVPGVGAEAYTISVHGVTQLWARKRGAKIVVELKNGDTAMEAMLAKVVIGSLEEPS